MQNLVLPNHRMKANLEICHDNREGSKGWEGEREKTAKNISYQIKNNHCSLSVERFCANHPCGIVSISRYSVTLYFRVDICAKTLCCSLFQLCIFCVIVQ